MVSSSTDWRDSISDAALEMLGMAAGRKCGSGMVVETGRGRNEELVHWEQRVCIEQDADEQRFESKQQTEKDLVLDLKDLRLTMEDEHRKLKVDLANKDKELEEVCLELRTLKREHEQSSSSSSECGSDLISSNCFIIFDICASKTVKRIGYTIRVKIILNVEPWLQMRLKSLNHNYHTQCECEKGDFELLNSR